MTSEKYTITVPKRVSAARFFDMLGILPPSRWYRGDHIEWFHLCEFLTEELVMWFARIGEEYYEFNDVYNLTREQLIRKIVDASRKEAL